MRHPEGKESAENELDLEAALLDACAMARHAGGLALAVRAGGDLGVERKSREESDIRTKGDLVSREHIMGELERLYPGHSRREEEGKSKKTGSPYEWIVDPIDGTRNFSKGRPFSVSVGLVKHGRPLLGVLHFPDDDVTIAAIRGRGVTVNGKPLHKREELRPLARARIGLDVSAGGDEAEEIARYHAPLEGKAAYLERLWCCTWGGRRMLEGDLDGYVNGGGLTPYDLAALAVILEEAGFLVCGMRDSVDFTRAKNPTILATHEDLRKEIAGALGLP